MGKSKEIIKYNKNDNEICRYHNALDASISENVSIDIIRNSIRFGKPINDFYFKYSGNFSDEKDNSELNYKCPYCNKKFKNYNGLSKHIFRYKIHGDISHEKLLTDFKYNGIRPVCKCGCGEYTDICYDKEAHFYDYKKGHHSKIKNNWGHNLKAINNSAITRRDQYKNHDRIQWNCGKKWSEVYDKDTIKKLSNNLKEKLIKRINDEKFSISSNLEKKFIEDIIKPTKIEYIQQFYIKEINQFCDIYLPKLNLIIEINGDYWHCNPLIYPHGAINTIQENRIEKDIQKYEWLKKNNLDLIVIWEYDIINNFNIIKYKFNNLINIKEYNWKKDFMLFLNKINLQNKVFIPYSLFENCDLFIMDNNNMLKQLNNYNYFIFEDEWIYKKNIVKSRITNLLNLNKNKIYARKCEIKEISYIESKTFLDENHIQGNSISKIRLGLFYNNELVSVMTFGALRKNLGSKNIEGTYELLRFCNKLYTTVVGGASKLFKYFIKTYNPKEIISYADKRWSKGKLYETLGFVLDHESKPNYFYIDNFLKIRHNRFEFRKDKLISDGFNSELTEKEIMRKRCLYRIYDCGCLCYKYINNN